MYAHGGRKVEAKGQQATERQRKVQQQQAARRAAEFAFEERVRKYSRPRKIIYTAVHHPYFDNFFMLVIFAYALVLGFYDPLKADDVVPNAIVNAAEPCFTILFTIDMVSHLVADGVSRFFSDAWNILDTFFVSLGWMDFIPGFKSGLGMLRAIKLSRTLTKVQSMKIVVTSLVKSIPGLGNVFALVAFMVFIFALFGLKIFTGVLQGRCNVAEYVSNSSRNVLSTCEQSKLGLLVKTEAQIAQFCDMAKPNHCPAGHQCTYVGNPQNGFQGFDNMGMALLTTFQAVTSEGWTAIMDALSDASSPSLVYPFFGFLMIFGGLFVTNYLLAESCVVFQTQMTNQRIAAGDREVQQASARRGALSKVMAQQTLSGAATKIQAAHRGAVARRALTASSPTRPIPNDCHSKNTAQALAIEEVQSAEQVIDVPEPDASAQLIAIGSSSCARIRSKVTHKMHSGLVDQFLTTCIIVNFFCLAIEHHDQPEWLADALHNANVVLTVVFAVELILKLFGLGFRYFADLFNCFDAFVVATSVMELALSDAGGSVGVLRTLRLVRIMRSLKMIKSGSALRVMLETAVASVVAVANFGILLLLLMYIYALLGMNFFGGKLKENDGLSPRGNFDTLFGSFITVFQVATRENWQVHLYNAMGSSAGVATAVVYFVSLLILTNYILLALFMGTLLEKFNKHFSDVAKMDVGVAALAVHAKRKFLNLISRRNNQKKAQSQPTTCFLCQHTGCAHSFCRHVVEHKHFDRLIISSIVVSSILLAVEHPNDAPGTTKETVLMVLDLIFTAIFTAECVLKIVATGFIAGEKAYMKSWWNVLDICVVVISLLNILLPIFNPDGGSDKMKFFRVLRTVRALRPLQAVKRWPGLRLVLKSIGNSIPSIVVVFMLAMFYMLIFAVFFVQLFKGSLYSCLTDEPHIPSVGIPKTWCIGNYVGNDGGLHTRQWVNSRQNFDNTLSALLIMFEMLTLEEWNSILIQVTDAVDPDHGPLRDNNPVLGIVFLFYIIAGSFFILNLFVGVIVSAYNEAKREADQRLLTNRNQEERRQSRIIQTHDMASFKYYKLHGDTEGWRRPLSRIVLDSRFEYVILGAILLNVSFMSLEYTGDFMCPMRKSIETAGDLANDVFTFVFLGEAMLKLAAFGVRKYLSENWNRFDGFIVAVSLGEFVVAKASSGEELPLDPTIVRLFRIFRVARFVRVAEKAKGIKNLIQTFVETLPYLANVAVLLTIFIFIYAVIGVALFANIKHQTSITRHNNFGTFAAAIGLLLRISTGEGWSGTMRDCQISPDSSLQIGESVPCGLVTVEGLSEMRSNCGHPMLAPVYFVSYMLVCTYMSLNIIVAVILFTFFDLEGNPESRSLDADVITKFLDACERHKIGETSEIAATSVPLLLREIGDPLGCQTDWHLKQCMTALQTWMGEEIKRFCHVDITKIFMPDIPPGLTDNAFRASCDDLFNKIDADCDGFLTKKEIKKGIDTIKATTGVEQTARTIFKSAENDASSVLDPDSFYKCMRDAVLISRAAVEPYAEVYWNGHKVGSTKQMRKPYPEFNATFVAPIKHTAHSQTLRIDVREPNNGGTDSQSLGQLSLEVTGNRIKPQTLGFSRKGTRQISGSRKLYNGSESTSGESTLTLSVNDASFVCTDETSSIDIGLLLRFLIIFQFDVDVSPPPRTPAGGLKLLSKLHGSKLAPSSGSSTTVDIAASKSLPSNFSKNTKASKPVGVDEELRETAGGKDISRSIASGAKDGDGLADVVLPGSPDIVVERFIAEEHPFP